MTESFNWLGRCARAAAFGIAALLLLTIARIVFFFAYKNDDLGFLSDFAPAMVMGLRVDAKWLAILLLPAWICVLLSYWKAFFWKPKSRSKPSRYSSENDVLIEKSVKYTDFFLLSIVYVR